MVLSRVRRFHRPAFAALLTLLVGAALGHAACDPTTDPDKTDIANTRAAVLAICNFFCSGSTSHGAYVDCAVHVANDTLTNKSCERFVKKCASRSTCGRPGFVTCCRTNANHLTKCSTKSDQAHCTPPKGGTACVGVFTSCCDACTATGCATSTTTTTTTTTLPVVACDVNHPQCPGTCTSCLGPPPGGTTGPGTCVNLNLACFASTGCATEQDCLASCPGAICVGITIFNRESICVPPCQSPSGAFLDESSVF